MALLTEEKANIVNKYKRNEGDTGSPEVQIALLTENINNCLLYTSPSPRD